jgi:hypothetical protein
MPVNRPDEAPRTANSGLSLRQRAKAGHRTYSKNAGCRRHAAPKKSAGVKR